MYDMRSPEQEPSGCMDILVILRAVGGLLLWPIAILVGLLVLVGAAIYLASLHPALVLLPVAVLVLAVMLYARWERRHFRPPGI